MKKKYRRATGWREFRQYRSGVFRFACADVKAWFAQENSQPNIVQVATNILVTMNLVGMGLGVTLIPGYMNNFNTGQVVFRPIAGNVPSIALLMAWKKGEMKPALRDFIAIVQERLANVTA